jgi:hypothetical protein
MKRDFNVVTLSLLASRAMFTSSAMRRRVVSRGVIIGMAAAGMTAAGISRVTAAVTRMVRTRRPDSAGRSGHRSRSTPAL